MKLIIQASLKDHFHIFIPKTYKFWIELYELIKSDKINTIKYLSDDIVVCIKKSKIVINKIIQGDMCKKIKDNTKWMDYTFSVKKYTNEGLISDDKNIYICSNINVPKKRHR